MTEPELWAEFSSGERVVRAAEDLRSRSVRLLGAYTPFGIPELEDLVGARRPRSIPLLTLGGGLGGVAAAYLVIWWTAAVDYPLNVGGRPLNSLPADIPILFESGVLCAALSAFFAVLFTSGLPRLDHELETVPGFARTSNDRYWLGVAAEGRHSEAKLSALLLELGALRVHQPGVVRS